MTHKSIETAPKTGETLALWKSGYEKNGWRLGYWCDEQQRWVESDGHTPINPDFYMELENPHIFFTVDVKDVFSAKDHLPCNVTEILNRWENNEATHEDANLLARYMCGGKS